jgi:hypothetical protein
LSPLHRGEKEESFIEGLLKSSPPFKKGRTGGICEPPFQKNKLIQKKNLFGNQSFLENNRDDLVKSHWKDGFVKSSRCKARKN